MYYSQPKISEEDMLLICQRIIVYHDSLRTLSKVYGVSKSCLHHNLHKRIPKRSLSLYCSLCQALLCNYNEKHIRGGNATKLKWVNQKKFK